MAVERLRSHVDSGNGESRLRGSCAAVGTGCVARLRAKSPGRSPCARCVRGLCSGTATVRPGAAARRSPVGIDVAIAGHPQNDAAHAKAAIEPAERYPIDLITGFFATTRGCFNSEYYARVVLAATWAAPARLVRPIGCRELWVSTIASRPSGSRELGVVPDWVRCPRLRRSARDNRESAKPNQDGSVRLGSWMSPIASPIADVPIALVLRARRDRCGGHTTDLCTGSRRFVRWRTDRGRWVGQIHPPALSCLTAKHDRT